MASLSIVRRSSPTLSLYSLSLLLSSPAAPSLSLIRPFSSSAAEPAADTDPSSSPSKPASLSARLSFVFDQLDAIERSRSSDHSARDAALRRIQSWHQPNHPPPPPPPPRRRDDAGPLGTTHPEREQEVRMEEVVAEEKMSMAEVLRKEVELVHPWPEWIELMERLAQQKYFDLSRVEEDRVAAEVPIDLSEVTDEVGLDICRDWTTVKNACMNFGRDRFDILKSLSRKDLQILVGHGCPNMDPKVVFSAKLIRKLVHLDEGDVCSSCSLRNSCSRGYILTRKEDEARTLDVMRILLVYGFDHIKGTVGNELLLKMKSVKTVVRKLLHEIVKLSAVPIDPNLPPPVIKKPPPKVKQPPPPPKKRVGRDDVEMKKGDWLCPKCDFMNFAKNTVCLQCDAKRPKRQLLPGEWECPGCNFLNYRRNMVCFQCEHKRPPDQYTENQMETKQSAPQRRLERPVRMSDVSTAWNFDFDDNESDGADVAAFEFADSTKLHGNSSLDSVSHRGTAKGPEDDAYDLDKMKTQDGERRFAGGESKRDCLNSPRIGFDDFDDEEDDDIDNYELDMSKGSQTNGVSRVSYSELEVESDSEGYGEFDRHGNSKHGTKDHSIDSVDGDYFDKDHSLKSSHLADSWQKTRGMSGSNNHRGISFGLESDDELISDMDGDIDETFRSKGSANRGNHDRAAIRQGIVVYSDDEALPGRGSDNDDYFPSDDRRGRRYSGKSNDDFPARGSHMHVRSSHGEYSSWSKGNGGSQHFDTHDKKRPFDRPRGIGNQLDDRSKSSGRNGKGHGGRNYQWRDCRSSQSTQSREGFHDRLQRRNDKFIDQFDDLNNGDRPRRRVNRR